MKQSNNGTMAKIAQHGANGTYGNTVGRSRRKTTTKASIAITTAVVLCVLILLTGWKQSNSEPVSLGAFAGPTGIAVAGVLAESPSYGGGEFYDGLYIEEQLFSAPTEVVPFLVRGDLDVVTLPLNLGVKLYTQRNIPYKLVAITGTGMLQVITRDPAITNLQDLATATVYGAGKGGTPDLVYSILATENGVESALDFTYNAPVQLTAALIEGLVDTALLPEPFATKALATSGLRTAVNMQNLWKDTLGVADSYPMTGIFVSAEFIESNPEAVRSLMQDIEASINWVEAEPQEAAQMVEEAGIMKAALAEQAIPNLELTYVTGATLQTMVESYVETLLQYAPATIGGAMPSANIYWE